MEAAQGVAVGSVEARGHDDEFGSKFGKHWEDCGRKKSGVFGVSCAGRVIKRRARSISDVHGAARAFAFANGGRDAPLWPRIKAICGPVDGNKEDVRIVGE
jgi:hypothetical protein